MIQVAIIGYSRHAFVHYQTLIEDTRISNIIFFHPSKCSENITNDFTDVISCDGVIISSPTSTHLHYIRLLCNHNYTNPVYLEKPGFTSLEESFELHRLVVHEARLNLLIGYQYPYTPKVLALKKILTEYPVGDPVKISMISSKGISYRPNFKYDWRSQDPFAIAHTLSCHHLSIYNYLFPDLNLLSSTTDYICRTYSNSDNSFYDIAYLSQLSFFPLLESFNSWGSPFIELDISIHCRNALIQLSGDSVSVRMPRDFFADNGYFTTPPEQISTSNLSEGLLNISRFFIDSIISSTRFSISQLECDIKIGQICLKASCL